MINAITMFNVFAVFGMMPGYSYILAFWLVMLISLTAIRRSRMEVC